MKVVPVLLAGAGLLISVAFLTAQEIRKNGFTPSPPGPLQFVNGKRYRITVNIPSDGAVITQDLVTSFLRGSALDPQFPPAFVIEGEGGETWSAVVTWVDTVDTSAPVTRGFTLVTAMPL